MNLLSWVVLGLVVLWGIAALIYVIRHRGSNCGGSCGGGCNGDCAHCANRNKMRNQE